MLARASAPTAFSTRPPFPITMPFWLGRSTRTTAQTCRSRFLRRNRSISTVSR